MELCNKCREKLKEKEAENHQLKNDLQNQTEQWLDVASLSDSTEFNLKVEKKKRKRLEKFLRKTEEGRAILGQHTVAENKKIALYIEAEENVNIFLKIKRALLKVLFFSLFLMWKS